MRSMDVSTPLCSFVQVKLNGEVIGLYTAVESLSESFALRNYGTQHGQLYKPEQMDIADMITGMEKDMFFLFRRIFYYTCRCGYVIIEAKDKVGICKWGERHAGSAERDEKFAEWIAGASSTPRS